MVRTLSLNTLAPDIIESILAGTEPDGLSYSRITSKPILVARFATDRVAKFSGPVDLLIELYPPDNRRRDADNSLKCLLDTFTHAGLYDDDSQIRKLTVIKREPMPPQGMTYIRITEWNGDKTTDADARSSRNF